MDIEQIINLAKLVAGALGSTVAYLFHTVMRMSKEHRNMLREQGDIQKKLGHLQGEQEGIERLSAEVLETVHNVLQRHQRKPNEYVDNYKNDLEKQKEWLRQLRRKHENEK